MEIIVPLTDIIGSYKKYLESKLGSQFNNFQVMEFDEKSLKYVEAKDFPFTSHFIRLK